MNKVLLIGSGNRDKAAELQALLAHTRWDVRTLKDYPGVDEPEETEDAFEGNALLKARYYCERFEVPCVADDSGLEVDALDGAPGVYSARYAGDGCTYDDNNRKLLDALDGLPDEKRGARFVCCAAFVDCDGTEHVEHGYVTGTIVDAPRGANGFGYDPVFVPEGFTETFGEMAPDRKAQISHRAEAFSKMGAYLVERAAQV